MIRRLYRNSRTFISRLREERAPPLRVVQELPTRNELLGAFSPSSSLGAGKFSTLVATGEHEQAAELLIQFYRERTQPAFFISTDEIQHAVERLQATHPDWVAHTLQHADRMAAGHVNVYANVAHLTSPEHWAMAPTGPGNDMLYRYRPHRFAFAPRLALAILYGHQSARPALEKLIDDWALSVAPDASFARKYRTFTVSSHVAVYRSVAVSWTLTFLHAANEPATKLKLQCMRILLADARYIHSCLPHTTANNHLLADGFGLWYFGSLFPEFNEAQTWKMDGMAVFRRELLRQIYPDGTSFEHSVHYQEHACEMGLAYLLLCRRNDWPVDPELSARIQVMLHFQSTLTGPYGATFAIGDTTEDPLFPLDSDEACCAPALRSLYGELFTATTTHIERSQPSLERAFWLSGGELCARKQNVHVAEPRLEEFPDGGFALFTARQGRDRLLFRTGPAPEAVLVSGHMHFDFLSVSLDIDGQQILVPGGTYSYRAMPPGWGWKHGKWRPYFLSARSANGLILSDTDPLQRSPGDFPGGIRGDIACRVHTSPARTSDSLTLVTARVTGVGEHAGWSRSILQVQDDYWLIIDELPDATRTVPGWFGFQFPPDTQLNIKNRHSVSAEINGIQMDLQFDTKSGAMICLTGSRRPMGGWISNRYGELTAAPQLLVPIPSRNAASACVISRSAGSATKYNSIIFDKKSNGFSITVTMDSFQDRFELRFSPDQEDHSIQWDRTIGNQAVSSETV